MAFEPFPSRDELWVVLEVLHRGVRLREIVLDGFDERRSVGALDLDHLRAVVENEKQGLGLVIALLEVVNRGSFALQSEEKRVRERSVDN